jgi:Ca2+-transporting ATPase
LTTDTTNDETATWYDLSAEDAADRAEVDIQQGLSAGEAAARLERFGPNELQEEAKEPIWKALLRQYADFMQLLLLGAAIASFLIDQISTGVLLVALTVLNAVLGYLQEAKAAQSVAALKEMMELNARVLRDGGIASIPAQNIVPGDIVKIEAGDVVPADGRIVRSATLEVGEASLTGESHPTAKEAAPVEGTDVALADRTSMTYMNTLVTRGTGTLLITGTGMDTQMGRIAGMLTGVKVQKSPLQRQMDDLAKIFAYLAAGAVVMIVLAGVARGLDQDELLLLAIAVAIGAIPTGLPTIVTMLLSIGTRNLADQGAIVKDLTSVETLGSTTAICSDKTGTLTLNQMTVVEIQYRGASFSVEGKGYTPTGSITHAPGSEDVSLDPVLVPVALCSDATVKDGKLIGDPTEGALVTVAAKGGIDVAGTRSGHPRIAEVPFDSEYKLMATFHNWKDDKGRAVVRCFVKGAPKVLLGRSTSVVGDGSVLEVDDAAPQVVAANDAMARHGYRVLAVATRDIDPADIDPSGDLLDLVEDLTLLGLFGIVDPPRPEAHEAIEIATGAGVRVRMITGDNAVTAAAVAAEVGIEGDAVTGRDIDGMSDAEFAEAVEHIGVIGRVAPEHKVRLVRTLQSNGEVVAMTGDGVNDAPALKAADIGVAMGITGTEVSKQAARMILTDDDFATIVTAIHSGRVIYDNLMKYIRFQMSSLVSLISLFVGATLLNIAMGAPLSPIQILWINFVITSILAIALGFDTPTPGLMDRPPRAPDASVMGLGRSVRVTIIGLVMALVTLAAMLLAPDDAQIGMVTVSSTMALTTLSLGTIVAALVNRDEFGTVFQRGAWTNRKFIRSMGVVALLTVLVTELGFLQRWIGTEGLNAEQWAICIGGALLVLFVDEIRKAIERVIRARKASAPADQPAVSETKEPQPA